jgi:hypothetical protein
MKYVFPLVAKIFEDDLDKMMDPRKIMKILPRLLELIPQKKKKRGEN